MKTYTQKEVNKKLKKQREKLKDILDKVIVFKEDEKKLILEQIGKWLLTSVNINISNIELGDGAKFENNVIMFKIEDKNFTLGITGNFSNLLTTGGIVSCTWIDEMNKELFIRDNLKSKIKKLRIK